MGMLTGSDLGGTPWPPVTAARLGLEMCDVRPQMPALVSRTDGRTDGQMDGCNGSYGNRSGRLSRSHWAHPGRQEAGECLPACVQRADGLDVRAIWLGHLSPHGSPGLIRLTRLARRCPPPSPIHARSGEEGLPQRRVYE